MKSPQREVTGPWRMTGCVGHDDVDEDKNGDN